MKKKSNISKTTDKNVESSSKKMKILMTRQGPTTIRMTLPSAVSEARSKVIFCRASRHQVSGTAAGTKTWMAMHGGVTQYDDE
mmetsp:Transcript_14021/g.34720  ORF Transcript_14021/g.34720 Transcript_14021/m.34720 type:complete len:83 (-) Transcript_14021:480-728(-)